MHTKIVNLNCLSSHFSLFPSENSSLESFICCVKQFSSEIGFTVNNDSLQTMTLRASKYSKLKLNHVSNHVYLTIPGHFPHSLGLGIAKACALHALKEVGLISCCFFFDFL